MKRVIYGMAMSRKDLASWIDNHTFQTIVALAQLYLFPTGNRVHWRKEVWEKFSKVYRLKNNKLPSAQFILENSWGNYKYELSRIMQYAVDKEENYEVLDETTYDEFYAIVEDYFYWLADKLSQNTEITLQEVKSELDRLGLDEIDLRIQQNR